MIVSIMQPYFFPYIGYFQLIAESDIFVFHDDVQYIKSGWVNRNRIMNRNGDPIWITLPVAAASHERNINERIYIFSKEKNKIIQKIKNNYSNSKYFKIYDYFIQSIMEFSNSNVADFNVNLIQSIMERLGYSTKFVRSSEIQGLKRLTGQARVIAICQRLGATRYVNPIGGAALYDGATFRDHGLDLSFFESSIAPRPGDCPYLSFIHTLFCDGAPASLRRDGGQPVAPH